MPITKSKKEEVVSSLKDKIGRSKSLVLARFHGLSVAKVSDLRRKFRAQDGDYTVAKKSLLKIALRDSGRELTGELDGEIGVAAGYGDELAVFKIASDFAKKEKEAFQIVGGFFEGKFVDAQAARSIGLIPSREALIAQVMQVMQGNVRKFMNIVDQLSKKGQ